MSFCREIYLDSELTFLPVNVPAEQVDLILSSDDEVTNSYPDVRVDIPLHEEVNYDFFMHRFKKEYEHIIRLYINKYIRKEISIEFMNNILSQYDNLFWKN